MSRTPAWPKLAGSSLIVALTVATWPVPAVRAEAAAQAETVARAEAAAQAETVALAEAAAQAETVVQDQSVVQAAERVLPATVGIVVTLPPEYEDGEPGYATGTGFVYAQGRVMTNAHVVEGASQVRLLLPDGTELKVPNLNRIAADPYTDIAIIQIPELKLAPAALGDSDAVQVGEPVIAVGYPLGPRFRNSVTVGVLAGIGRNVGANLPLLQTDAAINPGNSGGPLANGQGQVIGINSAKMTGLGIEGLGFSIPINQALDIAAILEKGQPISHPWLGVILEESSAAYLGLATEAGLKVVAVVESGPAVELIRRHDELVKVAGRRVHTLDQLAAVLANYQVGDTVTVELRRNGQAVTGQITLAEEDYSGGIAPQGILTNLSDWEAADAQSLARYFDLDYHSYSFADLTGPWWAAHDSARAVLLTEYLYLFGHLLHRYRTGQNADAITTTFLARVSRGTLSVAVLLPEGQEWAATLTQGEQEWQPVGLPRWPEPFVPGPAGDGQAWYYWRFRPTGLDPAGELTLTLTPAAGGRSYRFTWQLADLL